MSGVRFSKPRTSAWNPIDGCENTCRYCRNSLPGEDSTPRLVDRELTRTFRPKELIYAFGPSDMWGDWVPDEWIEAVISQVEKSPQTSFLFSTKNPERYLDFELPANVMLGVTIESNRSFPEISKAAPQPDRLHSMSRAKLLFPQLPRVIAIEPVMDFDLAEFAALLQEIEPSFVYLGYNNSRACLPEPSRQKTQELTRRLSVFTDVRQRTIRRAWWETG